MTALTLYAGRSQIKGIALYPTTTVKESSVVDEYKGVGHDG